MMQAYRVEGTMPMGQNRTRFTFETVAENEEQARDRTYATLGSRHRVDRRHLKIENVRTVTKDELTNSAVARELDLAANK